MGSARNLLLRFGVDLSDFEKGVLQASKSVDAFGKECVSAGKSLSAAITAPLVGLGGAAVAASETMAGAMNQIRNGTGATGDDLVQLGDVFKKVYGDLPVTASEAATAITDLHQRAGLTGDALQGMSEQMLNLAKISGSDVGPLIVSTQQAFANWGVATQDQSVALDDLFAISQKTGVGVQQLADDLTSGGAALRGMHLSLTDSALLLGQLEKAGVSADTVIQSLKKAEAEFAKSGVDMSTGLKDLFEQIKNAPTDTQAEQLAAEKLGKNATVMADAIRRGALDFEGLRSVLDGAPGSINRAADASRTLSDNFQILGNKITEALAPLGTAITNVIVNQVIPIAQSAIQVLADLVNAFAALPAPVQDTIVVMAGVAAAVGPALIALGGLVIGFNSVVTSAIGLKATLGAALDSVAALFATDAVAVEGAAAAVAGAEGLGSIATIGAGVLTAVDAIGAAFLGLAGPVTAAVAAIALIATNWTTIKSTVLSVTSALASGLASTWDAISAKASAMLTSLSTTMSSMWESIKSATSTAWDAISAKVQAAVTSVSQVASGLGGLLDAAAKAAFGTYYDDVKNLLSNAFGEAKTLWDQTVQYGSDSLGRMKTSLTDFLTNWIPQWASQVAQAISAAMQKSASTPGGFFNVDAAFPSPADLQQQYPTPPQVLKGAPAGTPGGANGSSATNWGVQVVKDGGAGSIGSMDPNTVQVMNGAGGAPAPIAIPAAAGGQTPVKLPTAPSGAAGGAGSNWYSGLGTAGGNPYNDLPNGGTREWWDPGGSGLAPGGGYGVQPGSFPAFANGGIVDKPGGMLALVGEAGPEAIIPLNRLGMSGGGGRGSPPAASSRSGDVHVHLHVGGSVLSNTDLTQIVRRGLIGIQNRNSGTGIKT